MSQQKTTETALTVAAGLTGVTVSAVGASSAVTGAAALITATGGAAAVILVGYGLYRWLSSEKK